jgi:hypothetical protein
MEPTLAASLGITEFERYFVSIPPSLPAFTAGIANLMK